MADNIPTRQQSEGRGAAIQAQLAGVFADLVGSGVVKAPELTQSHQHAASREATARESVQGQGIVGQLTSALRGAADAGHAAADWRSLVTGRGNDSKERSR